MHVRSDIASAGSGPCRGAARPGPSSGSSSSAAAEIRSDWRRIASIARLRAIAAIHEIGEARWGPGNEERDLSKLLTKVSEATARKPSAEPGLFFLASEFLDADASPERVTKVTRATAIGKAARTPIAKRSVPFLRLVRRLISDAE